MNKVAGRRIANTPLTDKRCILTANNNIFSRFIYKVPKLNVCWQKSDLKVRSYLNNSM